MRESHESEIRKDAGLSDCLKFRYWLTRRWDDGKPLLAVIGLNPSTADAVQDDPTIRRLYGFTIDAGCGGFVMLNLFAFRCTDPKRLQEWPDPIGVHNDFHLQEWTVNRSVLCCWGARGNYLDRDIAVREMLTSCRLFHLGLTQHGQPRHPLYVKRSTCFKLWGVAQ